MRPATLAPARKVYSMSQKMLFLGIDYDALKCLKKQTSVGNQNKFEASGLMGEIVMGCSPQFLSALQQRTERQRQSSKAE